MGSGQDYADSTRIIAFAAAGGLGLPDRDYYVKTDAKSQEIRAANMWNTSSTCWNCWAIRRPQAKTDAQVVMDIETALAKASLTRVDQRDPHKLFHNMTLRAAAGADARVSPGDAYFAALRIEPRRRALT